MVEWGVEPGETLTDDADDGAVAARRPAVLVIAGAGRPVLHVLPVPARGGRVTLGRELMVAGGVIALDDPRASRPHVEVARSAGRWIVRDLGSHNGTFVDGARVDGEITVDDGALVRAGGSLFLLVADHDVDGDPAIAVDRDFVIGPRTRAALDAVRRHATAPTLLVVGESGTGKERLARAYHQHGPRAGGPFVAVNCATIPATIAERALFGSRRGAYSGAEDAPGYVQAADGGTLFLDELGELPLELQAKLLRVLESREVWPVGATRGTAVDLGVVAATHRNLRAEVAAGRFRDDLYFRVTKPVVQVAALRERREEIPTLAARAASSVAPALALHPRLIEALCLRPWPGNARELLHEVRAAASLAVAAGADTVRLEHLADDAGRAFAGAEARAAAPTDERERLVAVVAAAGGNLSAAARTLGLHRTQLYRLLDRHGIGR